MSSGQFFEAGASDRPTDGEYDYIIVGSGAGGASAARFLADTGASIAIIDEGSRIHPKDFGEQLYPALKSAFRGMSSQLARGRAKIPLLQGAAYGGSTVVNSAIMWRLPEDVWDEWDKDFGLGQALPWESLNRYWDLIEKEIRVRAVDREMWGCSNQILDKAREALGVKGQVIRRADGGCEGSSRCLTGCPHGAKQSLDLNFLPYAHERGADVYCGARVNKIKIKDGKARGVSGTYKVLNTRKKLGRFELRAKKAVVLAASAIQSPQILQASGVRSRHLGRHFMGHPGCVLEAIFDHPVDPWFGATQGYNVDQHRREYGIKVETLAMPPEMTFVRQPGVGARWYKEMMLSDHSLTWDITIRTEGEGRVRRLPGGITDVTFEFTKRDIEKLHFGLRFLAECMFAGGAKQVAVPVVGMPQRIGPDELSVFDSAPENPGAYTFILSHLFGTTRMSEDPKDGVVGTDFAVHGCDNLFVVDASVFPTNMGVNPQLAIMGVAMLGCESIVERFEN